MRKRRHSVGKSILMGLAFIAIFAAVIAVVMLLWNAVIPSVIGWSAINYWQAAGLLILSRILFGKFGRPGGHRGHFGKRCKHEDHGRLHERLHNMSREERKEYIRDRMNRHRDFWSDDTDDESSDDARNNKQ